MMKHRLKRFAALALFSLATGIGANSSTAIAQDGLGSLNDLLAPSPSLNAPRSLNGRVRIYDSVLVHPMPVWSRVEDGAAPSERSIFQRSSQENVFRFDIAPRGESFKDWRNLFAVVAFKNRPGPIERQAHGVVQHFKRQCSPNNLGIYPGNKTTEKLVLVVSCGNYSRQREFGEIAAVTIVKRGNLAVTLMRQWKRKSWITSVPSQWPVSRKEIDGVLKELVRSRLLPAKS